MTVEYPPPPPAPHDPPAEGHPFLGLLLAGVILFVALPWLLRGFILLCEMYTRYFHWSAQV